MSNALARILAPWVRVSLHPEDFGTRLGEHRLPLCYVLEQDRATDRAVLQQACRQQRLPRPQARLLPQLPGERRSWLALGRRVGVWRTRLDRRAPALLLQLIEALRQDPALDVQLVPAAAFWGRAPQKERSVLRLLLAEDWSLGSRLRRLFTVLFNGRNTLVQLGEPLSLRSLLDAQADTPLNARRVARQLRGQLARMRTARIGPDLSHRRTLLAAVLRTRAVRAAVAQLVRERPGTSRRAALIEARHCGEEIAANYSHAFVGFMSRLLSRLWTRLYDGVEFGHAETLHQVMDGSEIIYVPCHRSHMDYLLLSYAIYERGYAIPHIAAGVNLNLPVVGRFLRKGGAFYVRRSFRGSSLYTVVFMQYLAAIMARGHSIEYFIEGGRSRTGRLLAPMTGMLSMTVRGYVRDPQRPVVFVPVYFGYERVFEGRTYISELSGKPKEKESVLGLLRAVRRLLRGRFGRVHVNLGEPLQLDALLARHMPQWRRAAREELERPRWMNPLVDDLADTILRNINAAAAVTPVNLAALALLATPRHAMLEADLVRQLELLQALLRALPYSPRVTLTTRAPQQMVDYVAGMNLIVREPHRIGTLVRMPPEAAVLATYYRNNVLHLVALPSLIACGFLGNAELRTRDVQRLVWRVYPYVAQELYLRWSEQELPQVVTEQLQALAALGLLRFDAERGVWCRPAPSSVLAMQFSQLAQATLQTIERYYLAVALLVRAGSGQVTQKALAERCQLMAQRMALLYGFDSPEFFDRSLFGNFLDLLRTRKVIHVDAEGRLAFDEVLIRVAADAEFVLSEQIRHSILQVTHD
ncbi:MAG: glycerol-3-phosphate 1-O-acyltransferase PlsB [Gammaproteobacteria bacterium]|nr:glycerol-3-phosphate 1-O-acyltransferase PlsB [Gammaproteobacteria bacterium]